MRAIGVDCYRWLQIARAENENYVNRECELNCTRCLRARTRLLVAWRGVATPTTPGVSTSPIISPSSFYIAERKKLLSNRLYFYISMCIQVASFFSQDGINFSFSFFIYTYTYHIYIEYLKKILNYNIMCFLVIFSENEIKIL